MTLSCTAGLNSLKMTFFENPEDEFFERESGGAFGSLCGSGISSEVLVEVRVMSKPRTMIFENSF